MLDLPILRVNTKRHAGLCDVRKHNLAHAVVRKWEIANSFTEEDPVTNRSSLRHRKDVIGVRLMHHAEHCEVAKRFGFCDLSFRVDLLGVLGWWDLVRHIDHCGDTATHCGGGAR